MHCNNVKVETGKASTFVEKQALAMLHRELFHLDEQFYAFDSKRADVALGVVTSGGTIANNTALWIARNRCLPADGEFRGCDAPLDAPWRLEAEEILRAAVPAEDVALRETELLPSYQPLGEIGRASCRERV